MIPDPKLTTVSDLYQDDFAFDAEVDREVRHVPVHCVWQDKWPIRMARCGLQSPFFLWVRWLMRAETRGLENVPRRGPLIIASNHRSHSDTPLILSSLPFAVRNRTAPAAAKDFWFRRRFKSTLVRFYFNALAITRRGQEARSMVSEMVRYVRRGGGRALLIYPEGGRVEPDAKLGELKSGPARVALLAQAPILPVAVTGTEKVLSKDSSTPKRAPAPCRVSFGEPIDPADFAEEMRRNEVRAARSMTAKLTERLLAMIETAEEDQARRDAAATQRKGQVSAGARDAAIQRPNETDSNALTCEVPATAETTASGEDGNAPSASTSCSSSDQQKHTNVPV